MRMSTCVFASFFYRFYAWLIHLCAFVHEDDIFCFTFNELLFGRMSNDTYYFCSLISCGRIHIFVKTFVFFCTNLYFWYQNLGYF
ncbi:hypothetical protein M6B38_155925 [Iris pallida]|uniref:Secreted protein n=1 Tax=Iris pallida TaxID=29817 RepID=A0AAX6F3G1_IRIPA|nr:hypothetical protein M6B38_155925 [Iris pallida]